MKILVLYYKEKVASNVYEHLQSFGKYSKNEVIYLDVFSKELNLGILKGFDVIVIHYTIFIFDDNRFPGWLNAALRNIQAIKVVFIQDEYRFVNKVIENLNYIRADILFTCIPNNEIENVYSERRLPGLLKINTLTGYISDGLLAKAKIIPYDNRRIDVSYRARKLSACYGSLGMEKWQIAERFIVDANLYKLKTDISAHEIDRLYGNAWIKLLQNSKASLGCESGASIFDFTGDIYKNVRAYERKHPHSTFEEIEEKFFKGLDGKIKMNQISPRVFECAVLGTLMILYEGEYSNILTPWRHYIPLKKDHSNMQEVVQVIKDQRYWTDITKHAYHEVALNYKYGYQFFVKKFDEILDGFFTKNNYIKDTTENIKLLSHAIPNFPEVTSIAIKWAMILYVLRKIRNKFIPSVNTLLLILKPKNFLSLGIFLRKFSYKELLIIDRIYIFIKTFKKNTGGIPLLIMQQDLLKNSVVVHIDPDRNCSFSRQDFEALNNAQNISINLSNSQAMTETLRNKEYTFSNVKFLKEMLCSICHCHSLGKNF